jgi:transposase
MGKARSEDLRTRVVAAVAAGSSRCKAAARFEVSIASAVRWVKLAAETGGVAPRPRGGKSRSPLEPHAAWILDLADREPALTLEEVASRIGEGLGLETSLWSVDRFFDRHGYSFKKNAARHRAGPAGHRRGARAVEG